MATYYNECDTYAAQWLRNLIAARKIADGEVDERSIIDVRATDLVGFTQCHFFAGIGVWSHALRLAGWPDDRPVWTGSCPCQPFSAAGKGEGTDDARHLWPEWFRLIREHRPVAIFGEQVSAAIRHGWLDLVCSDLEGLGYAVGAAVMGAHSVGAPHIRQRLYFVADNHQAGRSEQRSARLLNGERSPQRNDIDRCGAHGSMADAEHPERRQERGPEQDERDGHDAGRSETHGELGARREVRGMAESARELINRSGNGGTGRRGESSNGSKLGHSERQGLQEQFGERGTPREAFCGDARETPVGTDTSAFDAQATAWVSERKTRAQPGFWSAADWLPCIDGKARPVEPGIFPLVDGYPNRVGILRAAGNAIVPQAAAAFIGAFLEIRP